MAPLCQLTMSSRLISHAGKAQPGDQDAGSYNAIVLSGRRVAVVLRGYVVPGQKLSEYHTGPLAFGRSLLASAPAPEQVQPRQRRP